MPQNPNIPFPCLNVPILHVTDLDTNCTHIPDIVKNTTECGLCETIVQEIKDISQLVPEGDNTYRLLRLTIYPNDDDTSHGDILFQVFRLNDLRTRPTSLVLEKWFKSVDTDIPALMFEDFLDKDLDENSITRIINYAQNN